MIVEHDLVARVQGARGNPLALDPEPCTQGYAAHRMVRREPQFETVLRREPENRPDAGLEEARRCRWLPMIVDNGDERAADQLLHSPRPLACLHPRLRRDAWVGAVDGFTVPEIVAAVDAIDEHHPRFGVGVGGAHDPVPQLARLQALVRGALEGQLPWRVLLHRLHEGVGHQHRQVEHAQATALALRLDERLDVRMIAAHHRHHRPAARSGAHDRPAHRVPHVHERQRTRRVGADALHRRPLRPQRREVVADAATLLHRQRRLLQVLEDPPHVVRDVAHDEAVEQRDPPAGTGAGEDAAGGQELEVLHRREEPLFPHRRIRLGASELGRHPPPGIVDGLVQRLSVQRLQAVLHVPDLLRDRCHLDHAYLVLCEGNRSFS